ncbi:MAG: hypothetical protein WBE79_14105 [Candidatus Cybelea sp.]
MNGEPALNRMDTGRICTRSAAGLALLRCVAVFSLLAQIGAVDAPADQYFGTLKMSALRIRYETMQLKKRYETHELLPDQTLHLLLLTESAYTDWAGRYPTDSWLSSTGYAMALLYAELPGTQARDRAVALFTYVKSRFPKTPYAGKSRDALHRGVSVKAEPAWAAQTPKPSPLPSAPPSGAASPLPSPVVSPSPAPLHRRPDDDPSLTFITLDQDDHPGGSISH